MTSSQETLVIGASSALAKATINALLIQGKRVVAVSRSDLSEIHRNNFQVHCVVSDYSDDSIGITVADFITQERCFDQVLIFNGLLHNQSISPEKRLEEVQEDQILDYFKTNTIVPALWLKHLKKLLRKQGQVLITILSARVGSIADNRKGGWYGYRASKAALNMFIKSAAIEYRREAKNVSFLVYHPGTADTPLSKPYQGGVPPEQLFSPSYAASRLIEVINQFDESEQLQYRDWRNESINW